MFRPHLVFTRIALCLSLFLLPHMQHVRFPLITPDAQLKLERQRASNQVSCHALGARIRQDLCSVGCALRPHRKGREQGAARDEELGFGDVDPGTRAAADAELVVPDERRMCCQRLAVGGELWGQPAGGVE
jgi:hypothetical protein